MSDGSTFMDFSGLYSTFDLDSEPQDLSAASAAFILLHPTPSSVYNYLPTFVDYDELPPGLLALNGSGLSFSPEAADLIAALPRAVTHGVAQQDDRLLAARTPAGSFTYFPNHGTLHSCCAYRLFAVLGLQADFHQKGQHAPDDAKLGMLKPDFLRWLSLIDPTTYSLYVVPPGADHHAFSLGTISRTVSPNPHHPNQVVIFLGADHVSFALPTLQVPRTLAQLDAVADLPADYVAALEERYPPNSGRAGGKLLADWSFLRRHIHLPGTRAVVAVLLTADNDWEFVAAYALTTLPMVTLTGADIITSLLHLHYSSSATASPFSLSFVDYVKFMKYLHTAGRLTSRLVPLRKFIHPMKRAREWGDGIYGLDTLAGRSELYKTDRKSVV